MDDRQGQMRDIDRPQRSSRIRRVAMIGAALAATLLVSSGNATSPDPGPSLPDGCPHLSLLLADVLRREPRFRSLQHASGPTHHQQAG